MTVGDERRPARRSPTVSGALRVAVAGVGSEYRRDDGVGPVVAALSAQILSSAIDVGPVVDPLDLLGRWDGVDMAIVVDTIRSGAAPGSVRAVELLDWETTDDGVRGHAGGTTSTHGIGLSGVFRLARALGLAPARVVVVGVEGCDFGRGTGLSPEVHAAIPAAVQTVVELIKEVEPCA
jgi:hydrogenase maturation protease